MASKRQRHRQPRSTGSIGGPFRIIATKDNPPEEPAGWADRYDVALQNSAFLVQVVRITLHDTDIDVAAIVRTTSAGKPATPNGSGDIPWRTKQAIKNAIFGAERYAVEVFPPESRLSDVADMYWLWVFEEGYLSYDLGMMDRGRNAYRKGMEAMARDASSPVPDVLISDPGRDQAEGVTKGVS